MGIYEEIVYHLRKEKLDAEIETQKRDAELAFQRRFIHHHENKSESIKQQYTREVEKLERSTDELVDLFKKKLGDERSTVEDNSFYPYYSNDEDEELIEGTIASIECTLPILEVLFNF